MLSWHLGLRYLRRRRAAWLALAAITLTVAAPVTVIGVTQGFLDVLQRQARASESDITIQQPWGGEGLPDSAATRARLSSTSGVAAVAPFVQLYALMTRRLSADEPEPSVPCQIDGIEWSSDSAIGRLDPHLLHPQPIENLSAPPQRPSHRGSGFLTPHWREQLCVLGLSLGEPLGLLPAPLPPTLRPIPGVMAGRELLYGNGVAISEIIDLVGAAQSHQQAEITDTIGTGILEVDKLTLLVPLPFGQALSGYHAQGQEPPRVDGFRVKVQPGEDLKQVAQRLDLSSGSRTQTWRERRMTMVKSLEYQRNIMGVVMLAIQTIAVFVVYAVFSTMVAEKRHDIGVLLGIGARPSQIAGAFLLAGVVACVGGGLLGWAIGWLLLIAAQIASHSYGILLFPQDVFYSPDTPISWNPLIPLVFISAMAVIGLGAVAVPAIRAARIQPLDILREGS